MTSSSAAAGEAANSSGSSQEQRSMDMYAWDGGADGSDRG